MKVLLINPPWKRFFGSTSSLPPMGLCHLSAFIKHIKPEVDLDLYDADLAPLHERNNIESFAKMHLKYASRVVDINDKIWKEIAEYIKKIKPDLVGISVMTANYCSTRILSSLIKNILPDCKVVLGGKHVTALPVYSLNDKNVDYIVIGEGEITFLDLLENINTPEKVLGLYYKDSNGNPVFTGLRPFIKRIDDLPLPIFIPASANYDFISNNKKKYNWEIIGSRGCPYNCSFCATEHVVRTRSIDHIYKEINTVNKLYGIRHFRFQDDSFSFSRTRAIEMCKMLQNSGFTWECNTRVDLIDNILTEIMSRSNCLKVSIGIESASRNTLKRINKNIDLETVVNAVSLLKKYKIMIHGYFMVGFPWETYKDMTETVEYCFKLKLDTYEINYVVPLPGTKLFEELLINKKIDLNTVDWTRFQQDSFYMNYSDYSDRDWEKMLLSIKKKINNNLRNRLIKHRLRYFLKPKELLNKIFDNI